MNIKSFISKNNTLLVILIDILIVSFSFLIVAWSKEATLRTVIPNYTYPFFVFSFIWVSVSHIMGKYNLESFKKAFHMHFTIGVVDFIIISIITILLFTFKLNVYSRLMVLGTTGLSYLIELLVFSLWYFLFIKPISNVNTEKEQGEIVIDAPLQTINTAKLKAESIQISQKRLLKSQLLISESSLNVFKYFSEYLDIDSENVSLISTTTPFNITNLHSRVRTIINLKQVNNVRNINELFEVVNEKLPNAGMYMGCVETTAQRYKRIANRFPAFIRQIAIVLDFILNRILPRFPNLKNMYSDITGGNRITISKAEVLGRLVSCGFEIIEYKEIDNLTYFVVMKTREPEYKLSAIYGSIYKTPCVGKGGEVIYVYKFRTTHPFSEYLQDYVLRLNGFFAVGKPADDFRLTRWGRFLRKYWLDELPQIVNVLKGEMKLVGIEPLSESVLEGYPEDLKENRLKYKPGCIPPYVALLKHGAVASVEAERQYLFELSTNPVLTDIKYLQMAIHNIITNKIRRL
jgi:lipopolysaccharide/colanic/teichoic acid biosynthesis glycosyltransferase